MILILKILSRCPKHVVGNSLSHFVLSVVFSSILRGDVDLFDVVRTKSVNFLSPSNVATQRLGFGLLRILLYNQRTFNFSRCKGLRMTVTAVSMLLIFTRSKNGLVVNCEVEMKLV